MTTIAPAKPAARRLRPAAPPSLTLDMDFAPPVPPRTKRASAPVPPAPPKQAAPRTTPRPRAESTQSTSAPAVKPKATKTVKVTPPQAAAPRPVPPTPLKSRPKAASPETMRPLPEPVCAEGRLWKMSGRHGVAYVQSAALASELLATDTRHLAQRAMAVYYDKKGKAIAWQVRFDTDRWDDVLRRLG